MYALNILKKVFYFILNKFQEKIPNLKKCREDV